VEKLELQVRDSKANAPILELAELTEAQLAIVGGGIAEVILG
jgi:hypothetical protein